MKCLPAGLVLALALGACRDRAEELPALPRFRGQNQASIARFGEADRKARQDASSAARVGELAMLYHAYQFVDEARRSYAVARDLDPGDFRFVYYAAKLEKSAFEFEASETLFRRALEMKPEDPELPAELGELYLLWNRREEAEPYLDKALEMDPLQPVAALGKARLLLLEQKWQEVLDLLGPLVERHPRWSRAHQFLAAAHGGLGRDTERAFHQEQGEYGSAVESARMAEVHKLAVDAILDGDPSRGPEVLQGKCARCHDHHRIYDRNEDRRWWARTVRRMQREAGWEWLTDDEAAAVVAYLSSGRKGATR